MEAHVKEFFSPVPKGESVYFAFSDPEGFVQQIFLMVTGISWKCLYMLLQNKFHLFPDWYSVSQTNYKGAPSCWGRSLQKVSENMTRWNAKFSVVYQESGSDLDHKWLSHYELLSNFRLERLFTHLSEVSIFENQTLNAPKWFLLKSLHQST